MAAASCRPLRVVAGGGVAALETLLAPRHLALAVRSEHSLDGPLRIQEQENHMTDQQPSQGDFAAGERTEPQGPPRDFAEGEEQRRPGRPRDFAEGQEQHRPGPPRNFAEGEQRQPKTPPANASNGPPPATPTQSEPS
jgi:hypothetical protein